jgi:hypothetical protein
VFPAFDDLPGPWAVFADGDLLAVYERFRDTEVKPSVVLPTAVSQ